MRPMARRSMGYFPAAPEAIKALLQRLVPPSSPQHTAILDPCVGKGAAIKQLASGLGIPQKMIWAIELDRVRGEECKAALPEANVLAPCSFLSTDIRSQSYSLAYVNPPFDDSLNKHVRVEEEFLGRSLALLAIGGVLVFVCPENVAYRPSFQRLLAHYAHNVTVMPFPPEHRDHAEVFVLAQRCEYRLEPASWRDILAGTTKARYAIPKAPGPGARFKKTGLTDDELLDYLNRSPLLDEFAAPKEIPLPRPPLALGKGHLALLLSAGHLDGLVALPGHPAHVVRGVAKKVGEVTDVETDTSGKQTVTKTTYSERIKVVIRALWPDGEIRNLE